MKGHREYKEPGALTRYRRQHRAWVAGMNRQQRLRYRLFQAAVILAAVVIIVCLAVASWMRVPSIPSLDGDGQGNGIDFGGELPEVAKSGRKDGVYTFLVVGQDTAGGGLTDTMILVTYDTKAKTIDGMSLPRDTMINVSTSGKRLNSVYNYNKGSDKDTQVEKGMTALKREVSKLTGIVPDFYIVVQWEAVGELVEAIGGVEFEIPFDMDYEDPAQDLYIHLKAGKQVLNGEDAMGLIRWRHNNDYTVQYPTGDLGRIQTQQAFLKAVAAECLTPEIFLKVPTLAGIFMENVDTDLSLGNLLAFAQLAIGMDAEEDVNFVTMPNQDAGYPGVSMVLPVVDELLEVLNESFNPYQDDITQRDLQVLYRNSDGSYSVTSGTLQDPNLARPRGSGSSSGSGTQGSGTGQTGGETTQPGEGSQTGGETTQPGEGGQTVEEPTQPEEGSQAGEEATQPEEGGQAGGETTQPGEGGGETGITGGGGQTQPPAAGGGDTPVETNENQPAQDAAA